MRDELNGENEQAGVVPEAREGSTVPEAREGSIPADAPDAAMAAEGTTADPGQPATPALPGNQADPEAEDQGLGGLFPPVASEPDAPRPGSAGRAPVTGRDHSAAPLQPTLPIAGYWPPPPFGYPGYPQPGGEGQPTEPGYGGYGFPPAGYAPPPGGYAAGPGGYGPPPGGGYGPPPGGGYGPPGPPPAGFPPYGQPPRRRRLTGLLTYVLVAALAAGTGAAAVFAVNHNSGNGSQSQSGGSSPGSGLFGNGNTGSGRGSGSGVTGTSEGRIYNAVSPGLVDIGSNLKYAGGSAAATGMVISSNGIVLTNNHVIEGTTGLTATVADTGRRYKAQVLGYDRADDVAAIRLIGASGMRTVPLGNSATVKLGDAVVAIGNADGTGTLSSNSGSIIGLNKTITASDAGANSETLHGMLETNAPIISGDSGGPLVSAAGRVIGMDTAASTGSFGNASPQNVGFAIPINKALAIARQIVAGHGSARIQIGYTGFLGVEVPSGQASGVSNPRRQLQIQVQQSGTGAFGGLPGSGNRCVPTNQSTTTPSRVAPVSSGTLVLGALCGTPAARAGIAPGDVITGVSGHPVSSPDSLTAVLGHDRPGTAVSVTWVDLSGGQHTASITLAQKPPA
jgi:S1-C subfamily serine protease